MCKANHLVFFFVAVEQHVEQQQENGVNWADYCAFSLQNALSTTSEVAYMQQLSVCEMLEAWYNGCMRQTLWLLMV